MVNVELVLYVMLGAVVGMLYALRRVFMMEQNILQLEKRILQMDNNILNLLKKKKRR